VAGPRPGGTVLGGGLPWRSIRQTPHLAQEDLVSAGTIMAILPPLLLFAALNRFYVRGLFAGATKG
jgi:ABC-type glycerol-3-phosphate transport system permease component